MRPDSSIPTGARRFHYAWVIAVVGSIAMLVGVEPLALFGVFLGPIAEGLDVSRGAVSSVYWVAYICLGVSSLLGGWAVDRIGIRKTLLLATVLTVVPLALLSLADQLWQVYLLYGIVYGLARGGFSAPIMVTVTLWFKKRQGVAVGIVSSGMALGPMAFAPVLGYLINTFGWENTFLFMGIGSAVILLPCAWLMRSRPEDMGLRAYGDNDDEEAEIRTSAPAHEPIYYRANVQHFFRYAMTTQPFFLLGLIHLAGCISHSIPLTQVVVIATDRGIDPIAAATVLGVATGISATSRLFAPILADRIGGRKVLILFLVMQGISILWLLPAQDLWLFYLFSLFFGLGLGGEMTPFPVLNRQYYGSAPIGTIYGFQLMSASVGMGLGGFIGGFLFDLEGNYTLAIWLAVLMGLAGAALSYMLVDPFRRRQKTPATSGVPD